MPYLTDTDLATILAALRFYQQGGQGDPANRSDDIHDIATNGGEVMSSLDDAGIDDLCERINAQEPAQIHTKDYRELATVHLGLRLVQRLVADQPSIVLIDDSGTPSVAATEAILELVELHGHLEVPEIDFLYERLATGKVNHGLGCPVSLLRDFDRRFGDAVEQDVEINGPDAVDWISEASPAIRRKLQQLNIPPSHFPAAPSVHCVLAEFDARFGDLVEDDQEIDASDAIDWISEFAPRARVILEAAVWPK